jgi:D-aspartate ligase
MRNYRASPQSVTINHQDPPWVNTPVVVVGMEAGGLGVARSLGVKRIPVIAVDDTVNKAAMHTRYATRRLALPIRTDDLVEGLQQIAKDFNTRPLLISTLRIPLLIISQHRDRLAEHFRFTLPPHKLLVELEHKESLLSIAENAGLKVPKTLCLRDKAASYDTQAIRYPVILKPADNDLRYMHRFKKAYILDTPKAVKDIADSIMPYYENLVLQEWISGDDDSIFFCLQYRTADARVVASFVGQKLLSWPPGRGATAACISANDHQHTVEFLTNRLFDHVGLTGFGSAEFKRDDSSGEFYLIEPTAGRTDQQEEIATLNGMNIPYIAYCTELGLPMTKAAPAEKKHIWRNYQSMRMATQLLSSNGYTAPQIWRKNSIVHDAYFRYDDPIPGLIDRLDLAPAVARRPLTSVLSLLAHRLGRHTSEGSQG